MSEKINSVLLFLPSFRPSEVMPVEMQRKLYNTMGCAGAALGLGLLSVTRCDVVMAVAALCMVMAFMAFHIPGCFVSPKSGVTFDSRGKPWFYLRRSTKLVYGLTIDIL